MGAFQHSVLHHTHHLILSINGIYSEREGERGKGKWGERGKEKRLEH